jgi:hypothetical protein
VQISSDQQAGRVEATGCFHIPFDDLWQKEGRQNSPLIVRIAFA